MTHTPSEYFNIPFCRGQNGNKEKFKALGSLPCRQNEIVAGFWKKSITRCTVDYSRNVVQRAQVWKSEGLGSGSSSATHLLREDNGQVVFPPWASVFLTVRWRVELEDHEAPCPLENDGGLTPMEPVGRLSCHCDSWSTGHMSRWRKSPVPLHTQPSIQGLRPPTGLQVGALGLLQPIGILKSLELLISYFSTCKKINQYLLNCQVLCSLIFNSPASLRPARQLRRLKHWLNLQCLSGS